MVITTSPPGCKEQRVLRQRPDPIRSLVRIRLRAATRARPADQGGTQMRNVEDARAGANGVVSADSVCSSGICQPAKDANFTGLVVRHGESAAWSTRCLGFLGHARNATGWYRRRSVRCERNRRID